MSRITHFEIPSDNPETSLKFYGDTFGWTFQQFADNPYWIAMTGDQSKPGINGAIMKKNHPQQPLTNSIEVESVDEAVKKIKANGGTVVVEKMPIPTVGWVAYFKDPDQNIMGVFQYDDKAGG